MEQKQAITKVSAFGLSNNNKPKYTATTSGQNYVSCN